MLTRYPLTGAVRIFVGAGKPLPAWDGPILGPLGDVLPHVSFKTWDLPALTAWLDAMPDRPLILTYAHEPEQGTDAGDPPLEVWRTRWAELVAALADHPRRDQVLLVPVYTRYWWQAHPGDLRWLLPGLGIDAIGWDIYNNGTTYRTPDDLLSIPRDIAARTGLPYLLAELGAVRLAGDDGGAGRTAWMRDMVAAARADGAWTVCWFHKDEWDLTGPASADEQQTWRELTQEEATMGRWTDLATWVGPTPNQSGPMNRHDGVVLHIAAGTYDGTIAWQKNPDADVSSHFIVAKDGRIAQMVDTNVTAWTQRAGNGEWLSVENEGFLPSPLTDAQVEANARILAKAHQVYGVPLQVTNTPATRGLGHHSMGAENGYDWGHPACPGDAIKAQKAEIVARAKQIINGEDDDMTPEELLGTRLPDPVDGQEHTVGDFIRYMEYNMRQQLAPVLAEVTKLRALVGAEGTNPTELAGALAALPQPAQVDVDQLAGSVAERVLAGLPTTDGPVSREDLEAALRSVLGSLNDATQG